MPPYWCGTSSHIFLILPQSADLRIHSNKKDRIPSGMRSWLVSPLVGGDHYHSCLFHGSDRFGRGSTVPIVGSARSIEREPLLQLGSGESQWLGYSRRPGQPSHLREAQRVGFFLTS